MLLEDACSILVRLEQDNDVNAMELDGFVVWPLIRHCLWIELVSSSQRNEVRYGPGNGFGLRALQKGMQVVHRVSQEFALRGSDCRCLPHEATTMFLSQPVNLQKLSGSELLFDRIVDPLVFLSRNREKVAKCYVSPWQSEMSLYFQAGLLRPGRNPLRSGSIHKIRVRLNELSYQAGLPAEMFHVRFAKAWRSFKGWYEAGKKLYRKTPDLNRILLSCWYFPDMMGLIAAAKECGIETIDVQHGKQGRYQGMYSWWTCIPQGGYQLMPDRFWCWGQPSCDHILASSTDRQIHKPFVGGFPWLDFYREYISEPDRVNEDISVHGQYAHRVLVTLQGPTGEHAEPIPDFLVEYLSSDSGRAAHFTFRCHPNYRQCADYCRSRLKNISPERFEINDGTSNLYDDLLQATHHITAYSSCCYEAESFGVPTLLFGQDAKAIYGEEIHSRIFTWTAGDVRDVERWLNQPSRNNSDTNRPPNPYIESSLRTAMASLMQFPTKVRLAR